MCVGDKPQDMDAGYGYRADGSAKQRGFLGPLTGADGDQMTEFSVGFDGVGDIPSLIPTLHPAELNYILQKQEVPVSVDAKLLKHAQERKALGKSPYWNPADDGGENVHR